jgi:hypothetical protein
MFAREHNLKYSDIIKNENTFQNSDFVNRIKQKLAKFSITIKAYAILS